MKSILWMEDERKSGAAPTIRAALEKEFDLQGHADKPAPLDLATGLLALLKCHPGVATASVPDLVLLDSKLDVGIDESARKQVMKMADDLGLVKAVKQCFENPYGSSVLALIDKHFYADMPYLKVAYLSNFDLDLIIDEQDNLSALRRGKSALAAYMHKAWPIDDIVGQLHGIVGSARRGLALTEIRRRLSPLDAEFLLGPEGKNYKWSDTYRRSLSDLVEAGADKAWPYAGTGVTTRDGVPRVTETNRQAFSATVASHKSLPRALILGERGTGKERFSRALHNLWYGITEQDTSPMPPFTSVDVGGVPPWSGGMALWARLFAIQWDATGGVAYGAVPRAWNGTVFLDELGAAKADVQDTLLRLIEEGEYDTMLRGANERWAAHCCFIGATNKLDLWESHNFRADVADRLARYVVQLPTLSEVVDDISFWAELLPARIASELALHNISVPQSFELEQRTIDILAGYDWPGNRRELSYLIRRMQIRSVDKRTIPLQVVNTEMAKLRQLRARTGGQVRKELPHTNEEVKEFVANIVVSARGRQATVSATEIVEHAARLFEGSPTKYTFEKHLRDTFGAAHTIASIQEQVAASTGRQPRKPTNNPSPRGHRRS